MLRRSVSGFTVVELISVIALLGIVSAIALPRMIDRSAFQGSLLQQSFLSSLRLSQQLALSHSASTLIWRVQRLDASNYQLCVYRQTDAAASAANPCGDASRLEMITAESSVAPQYRFNGGSWTTLRSGSGFSVLYQHSGFVTHAGSAAVPTSALSSSIAFNIAGTALCLSLSGHIFEGSC